MSHHSQRWNKTRLGELTKSKYRWCCWRKHTKPSCITIRTVDWSVTENKQMLGPIMGTSGQAHFPRGNDEIIAKRTATPPHKHTHPSVKWCFIFAQVQCTSFSPGGVNFWICLWREKCYVPVSFQSEPSRRPGAGACSGLRPGTRMGLLSPETSFKPC